MTYVIANITIYYSTTGWIFWNQVSFWVITETTKTVRVYFICDQIWGYITSCVCMTVHYMRSDVQNRSAWKCCGGASAVKPVGIKVEVDQLSCRMGLSCINMCCTNSYMYTCPKNSHLIATTNLISAHHSWILRNRSKPDETYRSSIHSLKLYFNPLTSRPGCMPGSRYTGVGVLFFVIWSWNC